MSTLLPAPVRAGHLDLARGWAADPDAWPVSARFDADRRWYHRLHSAPDHEVWLLTWLPGQATELHDHGPSAGALVVVQGEVTEHCLVGGALRSSRLDTGAGRDFEPGHIHRVVNAGHQPAVSLHVYGPALTTMTRYDIVDGRIAKVAVDRTGAQW